jgi:hypothetical protein
MKAPASAGAFYNLLAIISARRFIAVARLPGIQADVILHFRSA